MAESNDTPAAADDARRLAEIEAVLRTVPYHPDGERLYLDDADLKVIDGIREIGLDLLARVRRLVAEAAELRRAAGEGERKPVAEVLSASGRLYLAVNGVAVATEGDECRDAELVAKHRAAGYEPWRAGFGRYFWDDALLVTAAGIINSALAASAGTEIKQPKGD